MDLSSLFLTSNLSNLFFISNRPIFVPSSPLFLINSGCVIQHNPCTPIKVFSLNSLGISENKIDFNSFVNNEFLKTSLKINKLDILFKKIEKND